MVGGWQFWGGSQAGRGEMLLACLGPGLWLVGWLVGRFVSWFWGVVEGAWVVELIRVVDVGWLGVGIFFVLFWGGIRRAG